MRRALVLLLLAPLVAGCGSKQSALSDSDRALKDAGTSRIEMRFVGEGPSAVATGSIDYARDCGEVVISSNSMEIPGGELRALFIGRTAYFGLTLLGKPRWQKEAEYAPTATERFTPGPGGPNPDRLLGLLIKSSKRIETLDKEEIRGVPARHYRAHLAREKLGDDASYLPKDFVIDAWIDDDGLVRRLRMPEGDDQTTIIDLFDFGVEVDVAAPPPDEIVSEEEFERLIDKECERMPRERARKSFFCGEFFEPDQPEIAPGETIPVEPK